MSVLEPKPARRSRQLVEAVVIVVLIAAVIAPYLSPRLFDGTWRLFGVDYMMLHNRRVDFALESLSKHSTIPAWYPREQLGVPFWSNIQSFPLLPTRLLLLATSNRENLFTLAVYLSLALTATFTYLFARRIGTGRLGAAAAAWTFCCGGYFASRTLAGQLGMLESFAALPILLYLVERFVTAATSRSLALWTALLALAAGSFLVAAHPQHGVYAILAGGAYTLWRTRSWPRIFLAAAAMSLGVACFAIQLYPMFLLIGRSSRVLALDAPQNDIVMPYGRLLTLFSPWRDGAPSTVKRPPGVGDFITTYPNAAYFWDTINYMGWLPWIAAAGVLAAIVVWRRRPKLPLLLREGAGGRGETSGNSSTPFAAGRPTPPPNPLPQGEGELEGPIRRSPITFLALMAIVTFFLALPIAAKTLPASPIVILRSPARLMYFVTFAAALAAGGLIHFLVSRPAKWRGIGIAAAILLLAGHAFQVVRHTRAYMQPWPGYSRAMREDAENVRRYVGDGRVGIDMNFNFHFTRQIDDVGFFDSIMLAPTYRALIDLNPHWPPRVNVQELDGGQLRTRALRTAGVKLLVTHHERNDLKLMVPPNVMPRIYAVDNPAARVAYFADNEVEFLDRDKIRARMRDESFRIAAALILSPDAKPRSTSALAPAAPVALPWRRPTPDRIEIDIDAPADGFVRVIESFDEGWRATVNGQPATIHLANNFAMAVAVPAGKSSVVLEFFTPGRGAGLTTSAIALAALATLVIVLALSPSQYSGRGRGGGL